MNALLCLLPLLAPADAPQNHDVLLSDAGKTGYTIYVSSTATESEKHAADDLARFLGEISGATFPVQQTETPPADDPQAIIVGQGLHTSFVSDEERARLGQEGFVIRTRGPALAIVGGRPRGTLYGVYSFLEDSLGCRWFTPDVSRIPRQARIALKPLDRTVVPVLEYRSTDYPNSRDADWAVRNKINGTQTNLDAHRGGKIVYGPFVHTFNSILNPDEHFGRHPEYFSEVNGARLKERTQLCVTNPEVTRLTIETVRRWMREQPEATIFSVSQNDSYNFCTCANCAALTRQEGSPMGPYLKFVNTVAEAVEKEFPDKAIDTLAYQFTRKPPANIKPRPNVIVRLCSIECCFSHPLASSEADDPRNFAFAQDLRAWSKISNRLYIWDYVIDYSHCLMPFPNLYSLKENINFFIDNGVKGIYEEADYFTTGGEFSELRTWIIAKTLWDPSYDTDKAIDEFLAGYYEEAAGPIRRYINLLHDKARREHVHFRIFDPPKREFFTPELLAEAAALFAEAEQAAANKPAVQKRVRIASLPVKYVQIAHLLPSKEAPGPRSAAQKQELKTRFAAFDPIAQEAGISRVSEHRSYAEWAETVKKAGE